MLGHRFKRRFQASGVGSELASEVDKSIARKSKSNLEGISAMIVRYGLAGNLHMPTDEPDVDELR